MSRHPTAAAEIFAAHEIARVAGVSVRDVRDAFASGSVATLDGAYVRGRDAVRLVRALRGEGVSPARRELFAPPPAAQRSPTAGFTGAGIVHATLFGALLLLGAWTTATTTEMLPQRIDPSRIVFLMKPGPGGGGGGGGLRQPKPPAKAEMKTAAKVKSPLPPPKRLDTRKPEPRPVPPPPPPAPQPTPKPVEPPPPAPRPDITPQVVAPVVTASTDPRDRAGVPAETAPPTESQGSGTGGGVGSGKGTGIGEGTGAGIGPGSGGGTGGGPYRPGSGISPPQVLREVKPEYTEEARRRNLEGDVVLEIVVRRDGSVGDVKVVQGLGGGLDRRAIDAVRQWQFSPAKRFGSPVDVLVEVAVEFRLR